MSATEPREIEDTVELLEYIDLEGVEIYELHGIGVEDRGEEYAEGYEIQAAINSEPGVFKARFTMKVHARGADYRTDLALRYGFSEPVSFSPEIAVDFTERVAFMSAYPFLRESAHTTATRMGHPVPVLGLIKQGEFKLTPGSPDDAVAGEQDAPTAAE